MNTPEPTTDHQMLLSELARRYGLEPGQLHPLTDNPADGVYSFTREGVSRVLKCIPTDVRAAVRVGGQVAWMYYLAGHGAAVCRVLPSPQGELVELLEVEGRSYTLVCYEQLEGRRPAGDDFTGALFRQWGELLGQIHNLTGHYVPAPETEPLPDWAENARYWPNFIPADQPLVLRRYNELMARLNTLPKEPATYGLAHNDFQANNLRLDGSRLTVFDFDDCEYHWFAYDIAVALYFALWEPLPGYDNRAFATFFLDNFWTGYQRQHVLDSYWLDQLPLFLKLQEMAIYATLNRFNRVAQQGLHDLVSSRHRALLLRYQYNIENDIPYLDSAYNPWTKG